jgi:hypothetical protein
MSDLATAAFILMAVWLGVLTLVIVLTIRQIGIITVQLSMAGPGFSVDKDGPEVGSSVPDSVMNTLPQITAESTTILLVSATCTPCRTLIEDLQEYHFDSPVITLLAGRQELADGLARMLSANTVIVRDPQATQIAEAFNIYSTPFALRVEAAQVKLKTYVRTTDHFLALVDGHKTGKERLKVGEDHVRTNSSIS